jgi:hypothetical protein
LVASIKKKIHSVGFENRVLRSTFRYEKEKQRERQKKKIHNNFSTSPNFFFYDDPLMENEMKMLKAETREIHTTEIVA